jgi:adenine-specific DNA glycosylase
LKATEQTPAQKKCEIHYALVCRAKDRNKNRDDEVLLVQRTHNSSLMAGMWELPEITRPEEGFSPDFTVRHSITVTDYTVRVWKTSEAPASTGKWISTMRLRQLALTGLARKIFRKANILT